MKRLMILTAVALLLAALGGAAHAGGGHRFETGHRHWDGPRHGHGGRFGYGGRLGYGGHFGRDHFGRSRSHFDLGLYFGAPLWGPSYVRPPMYLSPPVYIERAPPVYVQRPPSLWYYCQSPAGYYPYVSRCSQAWIPVDPASVPPQ